MKLENHTFLQQDKVIFEVPSGYDIHSLPWKDPPFEKSER